MKKGHNTLCAYIGYMLQGWYARWWTQNWSRHKKVFARVCKSKCTQCDVENWGHFVPASWFTNQAESHATCCRDKILFLHHYVFAESDNSHEESCCCDMSPPYFLTACLWVCGGLKACAWQLNITKQRFFLCWDQFKCYKM